MNIDTSDYYPWGNSRKRPSESRYAPSDPERNAPDMPADDSTEADDTPPEAPAGFPTALSHLLSWILSPVLMPTYAIVAVFILSMFSYAPATTKWTIIGIVFAMTCVIPCVAVFVLTRFGDVHDVALTRRTDRLYPYIITLACLLACGFYLTRTGLPLWVGFFYIGAAAATAVNLIVNFFWKISAHGAGIGGFLAMLLVLNRCGLPSCDMWPIVTATAAAAGLLGAARVWLWRHTPLQTVAGEITGFLGVLLLEMLIGA